MDTNALTIVVEGDIINLDVTLCKYLKSRCTSCCYAD
jgi:hypothetical protein